MIINIVQDRKPTNKLYKFLTNYFNKTLIVIYKFDYICTLNFAGVVNPDSYREADTPIDAGVVKLVDTLDLGSSASRCEGSSPFARTKKLF